MWYSEYFERITIIQFRYNSSQLVLLGDSNLYIGIIELHEKVKKTEGNCEEEKNNDIQNFYNCN